jgi:formylglycine-generating enzyme required for sulfatase activity
MGSPPGELCRLANEEQHLVTLTRPFEISAFEVTQGAYQALMDDNPAAFSACGPSCPVESVRWSDAAAYCNYLSGKAGLLKCYSCVGKDGKYARPHDCSVRPPYDGSTPGKTVVDCPGYRLPTEAEWEYAYRAGVGAALHNGPIDSCYSDGNAGAIGWYTINSGGTTHEVGLKTPNAWGLYDMAGNVWEWVNDWYQVDLGADPAIDPTGPKAGKAKVLRGGSWITSAGSIRAAYRNQNVRYKTFSFVGFRVARTLGVGSGN